METQRSSNRFAINQTLLLRAVADAGQTSVGLAIGHDKSYVSRFINGEQKLGMDELLKLLDATGLHLVRDTEGEVVIPMREHQALVTLAQKAMAAYTEVQKVA